MPFHDVYTPPNLHYSLLQTFTGNPAVVVPDFAGEILCATDTNKLYRSTGTTAGALVELEVRDIIATWLFG